METMNEIDNIWHADVTNYGEIQTAGLMQYIGDPMPVSNYTFTYWPSYCVCSKSAREKVQDEILEKMAAAIAQDDLKQAKKLIELAKALKEL